MEQRDTDAGHLQPAFERGAGSALAVAVLEGVVEEGQEPVILLLCDRVELVVVALGAPDGQTQKRGAGRVDAVDDRLDAELLGVNAAFLVDLGIAMEARGNLLIDRGARPR